MFSRLADRACISFSSFLGPPPPVVDHKATSEENRWSRGGRAEAERERREKVELRGRLTRCQKKCRESAQAGPRLVEFHAGKQALNNSEKARVCLCFFISQPILEKQGWYCVVAAARRSGDRWVISAQKCFDSPSESETPQTAV